MSTVEDIMSAPGGIQYTGRFMSTPGEDPKYTRGCGWYSVHVDLWNIRQLIKISPPGSQSPDPTAFLVSFLILN